MLQRESIGGVESLLGLDGNVGLHTCAFPIRSRHRVSRFPPRDERDEMVANTMAVRRMRAVPGGPTLAPTCG